MNAINWSKIALKQVKKIQRRDAIAIVDAVEGLKDFTGNPNVKKLSNHQYDFRLRVGRYRAMFNYDGEIKVVWIEEVKKRDERTY